jgi:hypothetical protein
VAGNTVMEARPVSGQRQSRLCRSVPDRMVEGSRVPLHPIHVIERCCYSSGGKPRGRPLRAESRALRRPESVGCDILSASVAK